MSNRFPITIPVQPWYKDHSFGGKIVFPAVETMLVLAGNALKIRPDLDVSIMEDCRFAKFLEIPPKSSSVEALVECNSDSDGRLQTQLLSKVQIGKMRRIKEHGELFFPSATAPAAARPELDLSPAAAVVKEISAEHIYRDRVPFGPCYHTLQGSLFLAKHDAYGYLKAPELPFTNPIQKVLGSPFPLDGAMHAACVLGQQFVDYAPFPTGFKRRTIVHPTQPGMHYLTKVFPVSLTKDEQVFDLCIFNTEGKIFEVVVGLRMRNVGLTRMRVIPEWMNREPR